MLRHTSEYTIHQKHILNVNASYKIVNGFSARKAISGKSLPWKNTAKKLNGQLMAIGDFELKERYMYIVIIEVYTFYI